MSTTKISAKFTAIMLVLSLVLMPLLPAMALADEGKATFTKKYTYMESAGKDSVKVDEYITEDGVKYQMQSASDATVDPTWVRPSRDVTTTQTKTLQVSAASGASSYFDAEIPWEEEGFSGTLTQSGIESTPVYQSNTAQVDRSSTLSGLPDNDVNRLPQTMTFNVRSDSAPGATMDKALQLSDVSYTIDAYDEYGLPTSYTAHMNFRGTESWLTIAAYTVNCTYSGTIYQVDTQYAFDVYYEQVDDFPWWLIAAGGAAAAAAIIIGVWYRRSRALIFELHGKNEELVAKTLVRKDNNGRLLEIPTDVPLEDASRVFEAEIPAKYIGEPLTIMQGSTRLYQGEAYKRIELNNPLSSIEAGRINL